MLIDFSDGNRKGVSQRLPETSTFHSPKNLSRSVPNTKTCFSSFIFESTVWSNTALIKAHQWFGSFAFLCFPLELWNKRWWEIAKICQNTLFFCKITRMYLFKCSWKLPGKYSQMLIETLCAPKVVFRKRGLYNPLKTLSWENYQNLKEICRRASVFWIHNIAVYCVWQNIDFSPYIWTFFKYLKTYGWLNKQTHTSKQNPNTNPRKQYISLIILQAVIFLYLDEKLVVKGDFREENITMKLLY